MKNRGLSESIKRLAAAAIAASLSLSNVMTAFSSQASSEVEETMYINLDAYGRMREINVVKAINFNGRNTYTDFGNYTSIINMSDSQTPTVKEDSVSFRKPDKEGKFYFQGSMNARDVELPWTIDISYMLNGRRVDAEKLKGASGLIEIDIDAEPNEKASEYMKNNICLIAMVPVDDDVCYSVDAPDSQSMTISNYTGVGFECIPGKKGHFEVRLGSDDFETTGVIFMMTPLTMNDLKTVKDIKELRDDFRKDSSAMLDDYENALGHIADIQEQLELTNSAMEKLRTGNSIIHGNAAYIFGGADIAIQDLREVGDLLSPLSDDVKTLEWLVYDINTRLNTMDTDLLNASSKLKNLNTRLKAFAQDLNDSDIESLDIEEYSSDFELTKESLENVKNDFTSLNGNVNTSTEETPSNLVDILGTAHAAAHSDLTSEEEEILNSYISYMTLNGGGEIDTDIKTEDTAYLFGVANIPDYSLKDALTAAQVYKTGGESALASLAGSDSKYIQYANVLKNTGLAANGMSSYITDEEEKENAEKALKDAESLKAHSDVLNALSVTSDSLKEGAAAYMASSEKTFGDKVEEIDLINQDVNTLTDDLDTLIGSLEDEEDDSENLSEFLQALSDVTEKLDDIMSSGASAVYQTAQTVNSIRSLIGDIDGLIGIMNNYHEDIEKMLQHADLVISKSSKMSQDTANVLQKLNDTIKSSGKSILDGFDEGLEAGAEGSAKMAKLSEDAQDMKDTGSNLRQRISERLDRDEEESNFLNIDPELPIVSITSEKNQSPKSLSVIMRSEEITNDNDDMEILDSEFQEDNGTFLGRIAGIFKNIFKRIAGLFGQAE